MRMENNIESFVPKHRLLLLSIGLTAKKSSIYDAACFAWKVDRGRAGRVELVLAHVHGRGEGSVRTNRMDGGY
jgi:hypothetical protein